MSKLIALAAAAALLTVAAGANAATPPVSAATSAHAKVTHASFRTHHHRHLKAGAVAKTKTTAG